MRLFVSGRCPECDARNAAAICIDGESTLEAINDFLDSGLIVKAFRTDERVTIESCWDKCSRQTQGAG